MDFTIKELIITMGNLLILSVAIPYFRYLAKDTKLFAVMGIFFHTKKLLFHDVFQKFTYMHTANVTSHVNNVSRKFLFANLIKIESKMISDSLQTYIQELVFYEKSKLNQVIHLFGNINRYTTENVSVELIGLVESYKQILPPYLVSQIYEDIEVSRPEIIRYIKKNRETLELTDREALQVRKTIQIEKAWAIINKYDEMMVVYRNQLVANLIHQSQSKKNLYELLVDILSNSFIPVYTNMRETLDISINKINGQIAGIIYKGFPL